MRIPSPVKAVRPRGCAGCSIWPLLGLGLAQEKRRRKRKGEEEEKEKEEGRGREGEEGGGRGRKEWEEAHYPGKKEHLHTSPPVLGKWRGTVGTFLVSISRHRAVPIPAPQAAAAVLGEPLCLGEPQKEEPPAPSSKSTGA